MEDRLGLSYKLNVEFVRGVPSTDDVQKMVRGLYPIPVTLESGVLTIRDPQFGDSFSVDVKESASVIVLDVPFSATFRSVAAAYSLAWALADKFGGTVRDPQLGGSPSIDLAKREWAKRETKQGLETIFGGSIPADLKTRIKQRRGLIRQEIEIRGSELQIRRKEANRSVNYSIPILSLRNVQENTVANPVGIYPIIIGMFILILAGAVGPPLGGQFFVVSIIVIPAGLILLYKLRRRLLVFPGSGGNLLLEAASPSKKEVDQFLASIDRVRFAVSRSQMGRSFASSDKDDESMRVT